MRASRATRSPAPEQVPLPVTAIASLALHVIAFVMLFLIHGGSIGRAAGEGGVEGAGDLLVDVRVVGEADPSRDVLGHDTTPAPTPRDGIPVPSETPSTPPQPTPPQPAPPQPAPTAEPGVRVRPPAPAETPQPAAASSGEDQSGVHLGAGESELVGDTPGAGTGHTEDSTGRAAGSDRAAAAILGSVGILPEGATSVRGALEEALRCPDPIEGHWTAHRYRPSAQDWVRMELFIRRDGDRIRGEIRARTWAGRITDRRPPACAPGGRDVTMRMEASGTFRDGRLDFGSRHAELLRADCPDASHIYYPDHFTGTLALDGETLSTTNNDGHVDIDFPYRFSRVSCTVD